MKQDKHGNITNLARGGISVHNWTSGSVPTPNHTFYDVDQLNYTYNGNQVKSISDNSSGALYTGAQDFKDNASTVDEYAYDTNGNLTKDLNKKLVTMRYNSLNLPDTIQLESGHMVSYVYDPMGQKESVTRKVVATSGISIPVGKTLSTAGIAYTSTTSVTKYASNVVYGGTYGTSINDVLLPDGLLKRNSAGYNYNYYIRDHLGNVRVVIDGTGAIKQVNNYNAFGMEYGESAENQTMATYQNYLYGGKEFDRKLELNLYDFGARFLDATRDQWTTPDPLAEKRPWESPYAYCGNNPMSFVDPDGRDYRLTFDGNTVTVSGIYYTNAESYSSALDATQFYNDNSDKYTYTVGKGENQKNYTVKFDLNVKLVEDVKEALANDKSGEGNAYKLVKSFGKDEDGNQTDGVTSKGNNVSLLASKQNSDAGAHEVGHTLGLVHNDYEGGLMTTYLNSDNHSSQLNKSDIKDIISYPLYNKVNSERGRDGLGYAGKGIVHGVNYETLRKGRVK